MKKCQTYLLLGLLALICVSSAHASSAGFDLLAKVNVKFQKLNDETINTAMSDVKGVLSKFQPALDESSRMVSPVRVFGPASRPVMKVSIEKCVFVICQTIVFQGRLTISETQGQCDRNFDLDVDLTGSSQEVTGYYDNFHTSVCIRRSASGQGSFAVTAAAHKSPSYNAGFMRDQVYQMMRLQVGPITKAVERQLTTDGAKLVHKSS